MARITDPRRAGRMARVLISDVSAYASDQVRIGLEKDDLFSRLELDLARAREYFEQAIDPSVEGRERMFNHAIVDILIYANRHVSTHIW